MSNPLSRRKLLTLGIGAAVPFQSGCFGLDPFDDRIEGSAISYDLPPGAEADAIFQDIGFGDYEARVDAKLPERADYWIRATALENGVVFAESVAIETFYPGEWKAVEIHINSTTDNSPDAGAITIEPYENQPRDTDAEE